MKTTLLRLATERRLMFREWHGLSFGHDIGYVTLSSGLLSYPAKKGIWFWWDFHKHHGGCGGLAVPQRRDEVKQMVRNLIQHQINNPPKSRKPDNELKYEGQDLYTIICYGKHSEMILPHWDSAEQGTDNIKPKSDLKQLRKDVKWMRENNPDFEYKLVKLVEVK